MAASHEVLESSANELEAIADRAEIYVSVTLANDIREQARTVRAVATRLQREQKNTPDENEALPCGHPRSALVDTGDGTTFCDECDRLAFEALYGTFGER